MNKIRNLVFEGGGVWGVAYQGVLTELHARKVITRGGLHRVGGASAGAIAATLLAVGYTAEELGEVLAQTSFEEFQDDDIGYARDTARLLTEYGWYRGDAFKKWMRGLISAKLKALSKEYGVNNPGARVTMAGLQKWQNALARKKLRLPRLYLVGTNLSAQRREIYSAESGHAPRLRVDEAVRCSMSIPLYFAAVQQRIHKSRDVIVDGGLTWNYPVNLFDHRNYVSQRRMGKPIAYARAEGQVFNTETLGIRLDTTGEIQANLKNWSNQPMDINNIMEYGWALVAMMRAVANKLHLHKNDWSRTVFVDVGEDISFTDFDLSAGQRQFLVNAGKQGTATFVDWRSSKKGEKELARIYKAMA